MPLGFVATDGPRFMRDGRPLRFVGANYWYGAILGAAAPGGDRPRLRRELNLLRQMGVTNLRVLVGAEGPDHQPTRVTPALQVAPGRYNDALFDGLDYLVVEMAKRGQTAVLYFSNAWEWSGGYAQYLAWNGRGAIPYPACAPNSWEDFLAYVAGFHACPAAEAQYLDHVRHVLGRTNRYSGVPYSNDPAIFAWEIANEPRPFGAANIPAFERWISQTAALIKQLAPAQLVTTGSEGTVGCEDSLELFERLHRDANIDYLTMHLWPKNRGWVRADDLPGTFATAVERTRDYMAQHIDVARRLGKPLVLEEFGFPRDGHAYGPTVSTTYRDQYYANALAACWEHARNEDVLAGCNFWAYGGTGRAGNLYWRPGDPCLGDPPQEEQGLNSVFDTDTTVKLIAEYAEQITRASATVTR